MKFGISTPIVQTVPGISNLTGGVEDLRRLILEIERLGYYHLTFPEHVAVPTEVTSRIGEVWWGQLPTMGFAAGITRRLRLLTSVVVLPYHHPLEIVKLFGTVDVLSQGRLVLGVGVGTLKEEFDLLGAQFEGRGTEANRSLKIIRDVWGRRDATEGWLVDPCGASTHVPIWVGGQSRLSLDRALAYGDGWMPGNLTLEQVKSYLASVELPDNFEVLLWPVPPLDPLGDPSGAEHSIELRRQAGATGMTLRFQHRSMSHYLEQLEAFSELVGLLGSESIRGG
jgi:alkanesulfonate monooxygenase SsuD/methylene tetrahydromethanopterin reductase-like flavin-dependent oxidoreductase (luciferase family)